MIVEYFFDHLKKMNIEFFTGVPDSQLKSLCNFLNWKYKNSDKHIIAVNEGNAVALAAGYHLSTGKIPCVYMQNSGMGNTINPISSLLNNKVYGIPCLFIIGWRGEPDIHDEPQHIFQGEITLPLLDVLGIKYMILDKSTTESDLLNKLQDFQKILESENSVAIVVKKGALLYETKCDYQNEYLLKREDILKKIVETAKKDVIVSTTGKTSRELFEIREQNNQSHCYDFLTVGSMGHSSTIALNIALNSSHKRVWCIDGDGAVLMHMGAMALIGSKSPDNFIHVVINNEAHESVGGQPTVAKDIDFKQIALACKYKHAYTVNNFEDFNTILSAIQNEIGPIFIEVKVAIGSRNDLGRPTTTPKENKAIFMHMLRDLD